jgi:hypothetical protein
LCCGRHSSSPALPAPSPPAAVACLAANQTKDQQEYDCTYERVYDQRDDACPEMNTKSRQQPIADKSANEADYQIANEAESTASHHPAPEVPRDYPNHDDNQQALVR